MLEILKHYKIWGGGQFALTYIPTPISRGLVNISPWFTPMYLWRRSS